MVNASGGDFSSADIFTLSSYSGLSPNQIMIGLADLINLNPNYGASFVNGEVLVFGNFNPAFGADLIFSDTTSSTLTGETGVRVVVPEPATIFLAGIGLAGVAASMRRRRRN